jgi:hypothetical protein
MTSSSSSPLPPATGADSRARATPTNPFGAAQEEQEKKEVRTSVLRVGSLKKVEILIKT